MLRPKALAIGIASRSLQSHPRALGVQCRSLSRKMARSSICGSLTTVAAHTARRSARPRRIEGRLVVRHSGRGRRDPKDERRWLHLLSSRLACPLRGVERMRVHHAPRACRQAGWRMLLGDVLPPPLSHAVRREPRARVNAHWLLKRIAVAQEPWNREDLFRRRMPGKRAGSSAERDGRAGSSAERDGVVMRLGGA